MIGLSWIDCENYSHNSSTLKLSFYLLKFMGMIVKSSSSTNPILLLKNYRLQQVQNSVVPQGFNTFNESSSWHWSLDTDGIKLKENKWGILFTEANRCDLQAYLKYVITLIRYGSIKTSSWHISLKTSSWHIRFIHYFTYNNLLSISRTCRNPENYLTTYNNLLLVEHVGTLATSIIVDHRCSERSKRSL